MFVCESLICEHMPKTATARNNATGIKENAEGREELKNELCWAKKKNFKKKGRSGYRKQEFFWRGLSCGIYSRLLNTVTWTTIMTKKKLLEIEKEIVREVARGDKPYLRKSTDRKA